MFDLEIPIYCSCTCQTPGSRWKDPMKQGLSICPSCHLSGYFLRIGLLDFPEFWHGSRNPSEVVHDSPIFWKIFCPPNWGKWPKTEFFEFKENLGHQFSLNLFYNKNFYFVSRQILYLGKVLLLRHRPKCSQAIRLQDFKSNISPEQIKETVSFLAC